MDRPLVSVIVLNWNGKVYLETCFESLRRQTYPNYEIIMVDNASNDGSVEYVKEKFPWVKIIENKENLGYVGANNIGWKSAKGKYIIFLNNDVEVDCNWLRELVLVAESDSQIGVCASKIKLFDNRQIIENIGGDMDIFASPHGRGNLELDGGQYENRPKEIFFASGAALFIKRSIMELLNGFDQKYFIYSDEVDVCWRSWLLGYKVVSVPAAVVYHVGSGTVKSTSAAGKYKEKRITIRLNTRYLGLRNRLRTAIKNYEFKTLVIILPSFVLLIIAQATLLLLLREFRMAYLHLKAILWNMLNLKNTLKERKKIQSIRKVPDREILNKIFKGSYELLTVKTFGLPKIKK